MEEVRIAPIGSVVEIGEDKTREQEKKYHAQIRDIAKQVEVNGRCYAEEVWKAWLVNCYEEDLKSQGKKLRHPSKIEYNPFTMIWVSIRASTKDFSKAEGQGFIEYLYAFGSEHDVKWSEPDTWADYQRWAEERAA